MSYLVLARRHPKKRLPVSLPVRLRLPSWNAHLMVRRHVLRLVQIKLPLPKYVRWSKRNLLLKIRWD